MSSKHLSPDRITEEDIHRHLYTAHMPDPDLLIRTSGEMRISNYLLWQIAYTEIFVTERLWPDFRGIHLLEAIADFQRRERRYGGLGEGSGEVDEETEPDQDRQCYKSCPVRCRLPEGNLRLRGCGKTPSWTQEASVHDFSRAVNSCNNQHGI